MLNIETKTLDGLDFIVLEGEIDMYVAPKLRQVLLTTCRQCSGGVAIDLQGVAYMDSSGIATLIEGLQLCRKKGERFLLVGVQDSVLGTLKLAKLHDFFEIHGSVEEGLRSFKSLGT